MRLTHIKGRIPQNEIQYFNETGQAIMLEKAQRAVFAI